MYRIDFDETFEGVDQIVTTWDCVVCGRPRLCPYAAPCSGDPLQACWSCGDLLARSAPASPATIMALAI